MKYIHHHHYLYHYHASPNNQGKLSYNSITREVSLKRGPKVVMIKVEEEKEESFLIIASKYLQTININFIILLKKRKAFLLLNQI